MVFLGYPFKAKASGQGGADVAEPPEGCAELLRSLDHQRHLRGAQLEDRRSKKNAFGFHNRQHMKRAIFFHCGGLALYPTEKPDFQGNRSQG
jgi:hypothetical protein